MNARPAQRLVGRRRSRYELIPGIEGIPLSMRQP